MIIPRFLIGILIALTSLFLGFQTIGLEIQAAGIRALLIIVLTTLYWYKVKEKRLFFLSFLIVFAIAEILNFFGWLIPIVPDAQFDYPYYLINFLYIISYSFLIVEILTSLDLVEMVKKYPFHILVLIILDVFSVVVVTNTTMDILSYHEYSMELVYNSVIMILLTLALINFIDKDDRKAINLLIGSIFIFFSEVIQLAYFYVSGIKLLNVLCSLFLVLAFFFFYLHSRLTYRRHESAIDQDILA